MGFFDFVKNNTEEKYQDSIIDEKWNLKLKKILLSNEAQALMYNGVRKIQEASKLAMSNPSQNTIKEMKTTIKEIIEKGKKIENILLENGIQDIKSEHLVAGFYLSNICDTTFKKYDSFSDDEIKNTFATNLIAIGYSNITVNEISLTSIEKVRQTLKWIYSHPMK